MWEYPGENALFVLLDDLDRDRPYKVIRVVFLYVKKSSLFTYRSGQVHHTHRMSALIQSSSRVK